MRRNPSAPFTTSTLQQEASRKLGFSAKQTMQVAQRLYEGVEIDGEATGLITYMRTDGVTIIPEAIAAIRRLVEQDYSKRYLPPFIREYKTKAKNAQEAHEAIRPTDVRRRPEAVARHLERDQARLYELIWKRAVASQMASAELEQTTAEIEVPGRDGKTYGLRATGSVVLFDGFLKLYEEGRDDRAAQERQGRAAEEEDDSRRLPPLAQGDALKDEGIEAKQHFTEPPPRFTEATLVKRMEELGIGRPSTYASTLAVLQERDYVRIDRKRLIPEDKGRLVTAFLESFFKRYVEYDFTADLEEKLDLISDGKLEYKDVLRDFWRDFMKAVGEIKDLRVGDVLEALNEILGPHIFPPRADGGDPRQCPNCGEGRLSLKVSGKYGAFIGCSRYPDCRYTRQLTQNGDGPAEASTPDGKLIGYDPDSGSPSRCATGASDPISSSARAPRRRSRSAPRCRAAWMPTAVDLERALQLLSLPRAIGNHPETGKPITAGLGRYGPFIQHDGIYANLPSVEEVFTVGINRAVVLLAEKKAGAANRFQRAAPTVLKELGDHPTEGGKMQMLSGRYGPYVKHGDVNATLPRGKDPAALTVEEAVQLIAERVAKGPSKPRRGGARAAKPKRNGNGPTEPRASPRRGQRPGAGQGQAGAKPGGHDLRQEGGPQTQTRRSSAGLPSKHQILEFIKGAQARPAGKREIARAFSVKGSDRVALKRLLAEMAEEGLLSGNRRGFKEPGILPPVAVIEIVARDADGDLIAEPASWEDGAGERPRVLVLAARGPARAGEPALGQGDRILARLTRLEEADVAGLPLRGGAHQAPAEGEEPPARHLPRACQGRRRHRPRRPQGAEGVEDRPRRRRQGQGRRSRALRSRPRRALGRPAGARRRDARQPAGPAQDQPDCRARLRASRRVPARGAGRGRDAGGRQARRPHRPALAASPDHRPRRCARPRRRGACRSRHRCRQQGRLHRARRDRRCGALRAARHASRPGGAAARQLGVLPGPGRADAARAHLQRSVLAEGGGGAPVPRRAHGLRQARQQEGPRGAARPHAIRRQAVLRGGAGRHRRASEREVPAAPQAGARAAVGRLCGAGGRPRPPRAARSRPA